VIHALLSALLLLQATPPTPEAPSPAAIFQRAIACIGPVDRVASLRAAGTIETAGQTRALLILWNARAPRRLLARETSPSGAVTESGCDGTRGWMRVAGRDSVLDVEPAAVIAANAGMVPHLMVMALADRYLQRTTGPIETIDGVACRRLDLEDRDGVPGAAWFEEDGGRLRAFRTQARRAEPARITTIMAWTGVGPLTVPSAFRIEHAGHTTHVRFARITDEPIPLAEFHPPLAAPAPK
jgi:hypothetical protein